MTLRIRRWLIIFWARVLWHVNEYLRPLNNKDE